MMKFDKRLSRLEAVIPKENMMTSIGELYEWQKTPEGKAELYNLYNPDRNESE